MPTRLICLAGPLEGHSIPLAEQDYLIGRQRDVDIVVLDDTVSRRHCQLKWDPAVGYRLLDLQSRSGTLLNGEPITDRPLEPGDQIGIGRSLFRLVEGDEDACGEALGRVVLDDSVPPAKTTVTLPVEQARYLRPELLLDQPPGSERRARDLNALLRVSTVANSIASPEQLTARLLELVLDVVPAERSALLLVSEGSRDFASASSRDRNQPRSPTVEVSRTVVQRVLEERVSLMSNEVGDDSEMQRVESLQLAGVRALLCVPLLLYERPLGVLYLDSSRLDVRFDQDHLELATAFAAIAAVALDNANRVEWLQRENRLLRDDLELEHEMVGTSPPMKEVLQLVAKVAPTDTTVLIAGESGTGKELAARAIHQNSARAGRSFVAVNCAALPENLLESELFGHERGAFTGAVSAKPGRIELAHLGTLFLDEVGELAPALQAKLLRVLQEGELQRLGSTRTQRVDVRLIAASNRNLEQAVREHGFREDLYYRLNVVSLTMPPLRERGADIVLLAEHFLRRLGEKLGRETRALAPRLKACLMRYDWPGNVRELENAIERAVVLGSGPDLEPEDLPESLLETAPRQDQQVTPFHEAVLATKRRVILEAFSQAEGSYKETARLLGLHPNYLHRLIRNLDLKSQLKR